MYSSSSTANSSGNSSWNLIFPVEVKSLTFWQPVSFYTSSTYEFICSLILSTVSFFWSNSSSMPLTGSAIFYLPAYFHTTISLNSSSIGVKFGKMPRSSISYCSSSWSSSLWLCMSTFLSPWFWDTTDLRPTNCLKRIDLALCPSRPKMSLIIYRSSRMVLRSS